MTLVAGCASPPGPWKGAEGFRGGMPRGVRPKYEPAAPLLDGVPTLPFPTPGM